MRAELWIDRVKSAKGLPSDYAAAAILGMTRSSVSKYRSKTPTFDEEASIKVAHVLGINPAIILADQAMERAKDAEAKSAWFSILERLGGVAACALIATVFVAPSPAEAGKSVDGKSTTNIM